MRSAATLEKSRGRIEKRSVTTSTQSIAHANWPGLTRFIRIERRVTVHGETTTSVTYAITSLTEAQASADDLLHLIRGRWAIENRAFWVKDVVLGEDHSRIRTGRGPECMSVLKNTAINFLRVLKVPNLAAAIREFAVKPNRLIPKLGLPTF